MLLSSRMRLVCLVIVLVLLLLLSPQIQAQTTPCEGQEWAVYYDCPGPHGCCRIQVDHLSASDLKKEGRTVLGTCRTEEKARQNVCGKLSDVVWVNAPGGTCNSPKGNVSATALILGPLPTWTSWTPPFGSAARPRLMRTRTG